MQDRICTLDHFARAVCCAAGSPCTGQVPYPLPAGRWLTVIIDKFDNLSTFAAGIERLDSFSKSLAGDPAGRAKTGSRIGMVQNTSLSLEHVTVQTPNDQRTLITDLSLSINPGEGLMIVGASGGG